ncbi:MAG: hypothetical protein WC538_07585 [Thermoanaerobaculia bacterium]
MKRFSIVLLLCVAAGFAWYYTHRPPKVVVPPTRETIAVKFAANDIEIHEAASETAPVITKRRVTEPVSVVSEKEGWTEVKLSIDKFGWVNTTELVADKHELSSKKDDIRFRVPPEEVKMRGPRGSTLWLKVAVNSFGDVTDVRMWQNNTGKKEMVEVHTDAIKKAKFFPLMDEGGTTAPFTYDYKIQY